jgi:putative DNA-invertase from lambdoid prophage Rac
LGQRLPPEDWELVSRHLRRRRVAIYCRASTTDPSCARQERELLAYADGAGYEVVGLFREAMSGAVKGAKGDRQSGRERVLALAQAQRTDAILVTELSRWGHSTIDLVHTLQALQACGVSLTALTGLQVDFATAHGRMIMSVLAAVAAFEHELVQERVRSGLAAARARGKQLGRRPGQRPTADRLAAEVLALVVADGLSYRAAAQRLGISKNTVAGILKRHRTAAIGGDAAAALASAATTAQAEAAPALAPPSAASTEHIVPSTKPPPPAHRGQVHW